MYIAPLLILIFLVSGCAGAPEAPQQREKGTTSSAQAIDGPSEYANSSELIPAIGRKVKGNMVLPPNVPLSGNPQVVVSFSLFPSGKVADLKVTKSSGSDQLDSAVLRAIKRAEPLPILSSWKNSDTAEEIKVMYRPYEQ
jgi:TonB family protein